MKHITVWGSDFEQGGEYLIAGFRTWDATERAERLVVALERHYQDRPTMYFWAHDERSHEKP